MLSRLVGWCLAGILAYTGNQHGQMAWGEPANMTDGHHAVDLTPVVKQGLDQPVYLTHAADGSMRLYVVEQPGRIRIYRFSAPWYRIGKGHLVLIAAFRTSGVKEKQEWSPRDFG